MCKTVWYHLFQISQIKRFLIFEQLKSVIHAYVTSSIDQNNSHLLALPKESIKHPQSVHNAASKLILGLKKHDHVMSALIPLHWIPIDYRILFKVLLPMFKSLNGQEPSAYLKDPLVPYVPVHTFRSSSEGLLRTPKNHYNGTFNRSFAARSLSEWNKIPKELSDCDTVASFRSKLKTFLFRMAYDF